MPVRGVWRTLFKVLLIAGAYFATGKLGLLLAIPPGYTTAIWPPSGIALAALLLLGNRYWPGVWLGSFVTNMLVTATHYSLESIGIAGAIAAGATLQALCGAILIRRFVGYPTELTREREILWFFTLGGPVACLLNASIGVTALWYSGAIPAATISYSWWTWWIGDTIGTLIFAPLVLMWFGGERWKQRRIAVTVPLIATFAAAVLVFIYTSNLEGDQLERRFREDTVDLSAALERRIDLNAELLRSVGGLFAASKSVERDEFHAFTETMLTQRADLQALSWAPQVTDADRPAFEGQLRALGVKNGICERSGGDHIRPAERREKYYPVYYVEPSSQRIIYGFDLSSEATRRAALELARDTGKLASTAPVRLLQAGNSVEHDSFLYFLPIYRGLSAKPDVAERRSKIHGFAVLAMRAHHLVDLAIETQLAQRHIHLQIADEQAATQKYPTIYNSRRSAIDANEIAWEQRLGLKQQTRMRVGQRQWILTYTPTLEYLAGNKTFVAWMVLAAGLIFSGLVGAGALAITGRTAAVQALVDERTAQLASANKQLAAKVRESRKVERLKSEFISTVSHELRTPLTSIRGSLGLLKGGVAGALSEGAIKLVEIAYRNTDRLAVLINDILDIEKIEAGRMSLDLGKFALSELLKQAVEMNNGYAQEHRVHFVLHEPLPEVRVEVDANRFLQIMSNLLSNAAKFSPAGANIDISAHTQMDTAEIVVTDRGPGISEEFRSRIFQRFSQADGSDTRKMGGTGLGLAITKALVEQMRGKISYRTRTAAEIQAKTQQLAAVGAGGTSASVTTPAVAAETGTTFFFELPLADQ